MPALPQHTPRRRATRRGRLVGLAVAPVLVLALVDGTAVAADRVPAPTTAYAAGTTSTAASLPTTAKVNARIARKLPKRLTARPLGHRVSVGVADVDAARGDRVYQRRAYRSMLPASNMKLVTAVTAMRTLGLDTRLPTNVVTQGAAGRKVVLVAGGDPVLTSGQLRALARRTATALVAALPPVPETDPTDPTEPTGPTDPTEPTEPTTLRYKVSFDDSLFAAPSYAPGWLGGYVPGVVRPVRALVRDGRGLTDTSTDAARYFASRVEARVAAAVTARTDLDVRVRFTGRSTAAADATPLASFKGNSVRGAVSWMLLVSDNDIAEMLYRLSAVHAGRTGTWADGRDTAMSVLGELGVRTKGLALVDGSGVSRADRLTVAAVLQLLQAAASPEHPELNELRALLPVSGVSGTLKSAYGRYTTKPSRCARGKVSAKTGTLHDTVALSGYTRGRDGRDKVFSVLVNNRPERRFTPLDTRRAVDTIAATVTGCA